jgi:DNA mismatch repair protein MutS2
VQAEKALEFEDLRALLGRYVRSPMGQSELQGIAPLRDRSAIDSALADAAEATEYLRAASHPQIAGRGAAIRPHFDVAADPGPLVARLRIEGATLEATEIFELARLLDVASEVRSVVLSARERYPRLAAHASSIADLRDVARDFRGKILPDGTLADDASVILARLRRDSERQRRSIEESLARFLRMHHQDGTLQEDFVTIRNDRFVVPIVTGRERRVDGVIHGSSGSGATVFVEPLETIELNNELVRLHEEELREVHRLLREFTTRLREHAVYGAATERTRLPEDCLARCAASSAGGHPAGPEEDRGSRFARVECGAEHAADQRTEYGRQDRGAQNYRIAGADDPRWFARPGRTC